MPQRVFTKVVRPGKISQYGGARLRVIAVRRTCARGTTNHQTELDALLNILLSADLDLKDNLWSVPAQNYVDVRSSNPSMVLPGNAAVRNAKRG